MKTVLLIVNPVSGKKISKKLLPNTISEFQNNDFELEIIESKYKGHIEEILNTYNIEHYYCCCIMGGDGSFHEAINGLMKRIDKLKILLSLIPAGSGNSLGRDLNILNLQDAIKNIINGNKKNIDIAEINCDNDKIYSFNIVGWGMVANIGIKAEKYRWLGTSRYSILSLFEIFMKNTSFSKIIYSDKNNRLTEIKNNFMFVSICNTVHTGKGMKIAPYAKLNDGLMDLILIKNASRLKLLQLMPKIFDGTHINDDIVEYIQINKLELIPNKISKLNIDGEIKGTTPFKLTVIPKKIEIITNY